MLVLHFTQPLKWTMARNVIVRACAVLTILGHTPNLLRLYRVTIGHDQRENKSEVDSKS